MAVAKRRGSHTPDLGARGNPSFCEIRRLVIRDRPYHWCSGGQRLLWRHGSGGGSQYGHCQSQRTVRGPSLEGMGMGTSLEGMGMGTSMEGMGMGTSLEGMEWGLVWKVWEWGSGRMEY